MAAKSKTGAQAAPTISRERGPNPLLETPLQAALVVHDRVVGEMDGKWGTDVLTSLVAPDRAAKLAEARQEYDAAIGAGDDGKAVKALGRIVKGLAVLDLEAAAAGHEPLNPGRCWCTRDEGGNPWVFVQTADDARAAARLDRFRGYQVWSLPEVIRALNDKSFEAVLKAKELWPEAEVKAVKVKPKVDWKKGDDVPF